MTKNEERKVLEQIDKLIASTGEDSYISMAFAGCVLMAYENIENDWGCNYPSVIQKANTNIETLAARIRELEQVVDELTAGNKELIKELKVEKKKQIPAKLYMDLWLTIEARETEAKNEITKIAEVLSYTESITETGIGSYIEALKQARVTRDSAAKLLAELEKCEPKNV